MVEKSIRADEGIDAFSSPSCPCSPEQGSMCWSGSPQHCPCSGLGQAGTVWGRTWSAMENAAPGCPSGPSKVWGWGSSLGTAACTLHSRHDGVGITQEGARAQPGPTSTELYKPVQNKSPSLGASKGPSLVSRHLFLLNLGEHYYPQLGCQSQLEVTAASMKHDSRTDTQHARTEPGGSHKLVLL